MLSLGLVFRLYKNKLTSQVLIVCSRKAKLGEVFYDQEMSSVAACIQTEAWTLIDELKIWAISQQDSPRKARVQVSLRMSTVC
jgi:hypothetical protein